MRWQMGTFTPHQGRTYPLGKGRWLPWAPKSQGPPKMLFIYEMRIKRGHANGFCLSCLLPRVTTTVCVSELNVLLVYPGCSKWKYYASEADCRASARSLFPSAHTSSLSESALFSELRFQLKTVCCFSNLTCKYSRNHSYCLYLMCSYLILFILFYHFIIYFVFLLKLVS